MIAEQTHFIRSHLKLNAKIVPSCVIDVNDKMNEGKSKKGKEKQNKQTFGPGTLRPVPTPARHWDVPKYQGRYK